MVTDLWLELSKIGLKVGLTVLSTPILFLKKSSSLSLSVSI
jgi:hypothetical protein